VKVSTKATVAQDHVRRQGSAFRQSRQARQTINLSVIGCFKNHYSSLSWLMFVYYYLFM